MIFLEDVRNAARIIAPFAMRLEDRPGALHIELETRNAGHIEKVKTALKQAGHQIEF